MLLDSFIGDYLIGFLHGFGLKSNIGFRSTTSANSKTDIHLQQSFNSLDQQPLLKLKKL
jgi:hypothetical protein